MDGQAGKSPLDEEIASFLRRQKTPKVLAVNKCETTVLGDAQAADFWSLGLGSPWPVSRWEGNDPQRFRILAQKGPDAAADDTLRQGRIHQRDLPAATKQASLATNAPGRIGPSV